MTLHAIAGTEPEISVIIPCYRQAQFLAQAVDSALAQEVAEKEVIVINDGSPDLTREVSARYGDDIVYIEQENLGVSAARNAGIRAARGKYIAFLDSDDIYLPCTLKTQRRYLNQHPGIALVCGNAETFDDRSDFLGPHFPLTGPKPRQSNFRWETVSFYPVFSTVMMRRECFGISGYFDERLVNAAEDWLMCVRMSRFFDMAFLDRPLVRYRIHPYSATRNVEQIKSGTRLAAAKVVDDLGFREYPSHFRAKLLYYRSATAWRSEGTLSTIKFMIKALLTDPMQIRFGLLVIRAGMRNTFLRIIGSR